MSSPVFSRSQLLLLLTLAGIQFCHVLDFMILMPLGPELMRVFSISPQQFAWLVACYSFSAALAGILGAMFVDRVERKRLLLVLFCLFGLATLACALAPNYHSLLFARCCAGLFGGLLGAMVHTIIGDVIPFESRARASSWVAAAFSMATVVGVPLSLWLSHELSWRAPFMLIVVLVLLFSMIAALTLPVLKTHVSLESRHPLVSIKQVLVEHNHWRAYLFSFLVVFSGFLVIPYVAMYSVTNIGLLSSDVAWLYCCGGIATLITGRLIGCWADRHGKILLFRVIALLAVLPVLLVTQLQAASMSVWLVCTTLFFIFVSGRMIPVVAIMVSITSANLRGTFMSLNATLQQLASGSASVIGGLILVQTPEGGLLHYAEVGYLAILVNLLAIFWVGRVLMKS